MSENSTATGITGIIQEHLTLLVSLALGYAAAVEFGYASYPSVPDGTGLLVAGGAITVTVGWIAAGKIHDLLPEEEGIYLMAFKASTERGGELWELTEDQFEDMEVVAGSLFQWETGKRVYECREYRPEKNEAVGNWRESVAASELVGDVRVTDAMEQIAEIREEFEPAERDLRRLKRRLRGITRKLDRRRSEDQQAILDENLTPEFGGSDGATISEVLAEELPNDLRPESMDADEQTDETPDGKADGEEFAGFELLENDNEALLND